MDFLLIGGNVDTSLDSNTLNDSRHFCEGVIFLSLCGNGTSSKETMSFLFEIVL